MDKLKYFKGKTCTLYTRSTCRHFDETQFANSFVGLVEEVDEYGIWLIQLTNKKKSFFFHSGIVGIIETAITFMTDGEAAILKKELERKTSSPSNLISPESLNIIKKKAQSK